MTAKTGRSVQRRHKWPIIELFSITSSRYLVGLASEMVMIAAPAGVQINRGLRMPRLKLLKGYWQKIQSWLRPLTHAGIPTGTSRPEERELVTANIVVIFSILVTVPDALNFFSFSNSATRYAALVATSAICVYALGFALLSLGKRWLGILLFTNAVLVNLAALTIILGTLCGTQYYFVAVGVGAMFVWPRAHKRMRVPQAVLGLVLFFVTMKIAGAGPIVGPALPPDIVDSVFNRTTIGAYAIAFGLAFYSLSATERAESALKMEHEQSESLLLNILPQAIAVRLIQKDQLIADAFDNVTILFADVVWFTPLSAKLPPSELVEFLNRLFSEFDLLAEKHGLEKIKTIGDAYMVVGGIPVPRSDHASAIAQLALEMQEVVRTTQPPVGEPLLLRIGINSGPAIAGVIGIRKFAYDLWGDTVNTAIKDGVAWTSWLDPGDRGNASTPTGRFRF